MTAPAPPSPVVVVGAGLGGLRVVEQLRRTGHEGPLVLLGAEHEHPYDRPPLSKQVLRGEQDELPVLRPVADYDELDVDLRLGVPATGLDVDARVLNLADGSHLRYASLVLAPGAVPKLLPGSSSRPGLHVLRTHEDAVALRAAIRATGELTVLGGGFIGCEVAASARGLGARVSLVEQLAGPLVRAVGPAVAGRVRQWHLEHGVSLHCGTGVAQILGQDRVTGLELTDGTRLDTSVVLVGLGVRPDTGWLGDAVTLTADGAIGCDRFGRTSAAGVWAVGDAAAWTDATGRQRRVEHWMSAVEQAATVAQNLHAAPDALVPHVGIPYFWSDQYDSSLQAFGEVAPETEQLSGPAGDGMAALHADGGRLLGIVLLDAPRLAGKARKLLRGGGGLEQARQTLLS